MTLTVVAQGNGIAQVRMGVAGKLSTRILPQQRQVHTTENSQELVTMTTIIATPTPSPDVGVSMGIHNDGSLHDISESKDMEAWRPRQVLLSRLPLRKLLQGVGIAH